MAESSSSTVGGVLEARLSEGRVVLWREEDSQRLYGEAYYGKPLGVRKPKAADFEAPLELAPYEALYLSEEGRMVVRDGEGKVIAVDELRDVLFAAHGMLPDLYRVYRDLKSKGYIVRSGMKFGAAFAVYEYGPGVDHAPFLVEVLPSNSMLDPLQIVRAGRLSHSVRKRFVIATIEPFTEAITYYAFKWFKA